MRLVTEIDEQKYEDFVKNHPKSHFLQSYTWGQFEAKVMDRTPYYVGLVDEQDHLVAATLLLQKKLPLGYCYFYAPRGYVIDFKNNTLLTEFTKELKKFAKKKKALFIKIDPDIKLHTLDPDGKVLDEEENNYEVVENLKKLGYRHFGYNKNFENSEPRYTFRLDLTPSIEEINEHFHPTTKKIIKRGNPFHLKLEKNEKAKIEDFYLTMMETAKREQVLYHDQNYYEAFYQTLHEKNESDLYVVSIDIEELKKEEQEKIRELKEKIASFEGKDDTKNQNKKQELVNQLTKKEKSFQEIEKIQEKELVLSSILTAKYGNKVWTVHGGNHSLLRELNANYFIYYEIIKAAKEEGYQLIDFFGTTGDPKEDNPIYGIHLFKKRLGGEYTEFIGEFDLVTNRFMYFIFQKLIPFYRNRKRKENKKKND